MRVLITGASGLLGHDIACPDRAGAQKGLKAGAYSYYQFDICDKKMLSSVFEAFCPDAVIHCAAWRDAVSAELPENESAVFSVNAEATRNIALLCRIYGAEMIYISSDYVFSGEGNLPWKPECTYLDPLNVYGRSKLAGEQAVSEVLQSFFIVRTAWLFGPNGNNFVSTMLKLGKKHGELSVVDDQIGVPTYTKDLAKLISDMIFSRKFGIYHATNTGSYISRYDFAEEIFRQAGIRVSLRKVSTKEFLVDTLPRPLNGRLDTSSLQANGFCPLPGWEDALTRYLRDCERDYEKIGD